MMKVSRRGLCEASSVTSVPSVVKTWNFMRIAYLECFSGMSGDMFLGALIDAGVPPRLLEETVAALGVGARLEISRVVRSGIAATKVDVWVDGEKDLPREEYWAKQNEEPALLRQAQGRGRPPPHNHPGQPSISPAPKPALTPAQPIPPPRTVPGGGPSPGPAEGAPAP